MEESIKNLGAIKFSIWSPIEIRKFSVAEITAPETYDEDVLSFQRFKCSGRVNFGRFKGIY